MWLWAGLIAFGAVLVSLDDGPLAWGVIAGGITLTLVLTFVLPRLQSPGSL